MESISRQAGLASDDTQTKYDQDIGNAETEDEMLQLTVQFFEDGARQTENALTKVRALNPPSEAKDAHEEFVAATDALIALFDDIIAQSRDATSASGVQDLSAELDTRYSDVTDRAGRACAALQDLADANNIDVDLRCDGSAASSGDGGGAAPANGDASSQELDDYFSAIEVIFANAEAELAAIGDDLEATVNDTTSDAGQVQAFRDAFELTGQAIESALLKLAEIDVPAEAEDAHSAFVDSKIDVLHLSAEILNDLGDFTTAAEVESYFEKRQPELDDVTAVSDETCFELQSIADDHQIDVDLNCED